MKREEFAVSLRKKKSKDIINAKRRKLEQPSSQIVNLEQNVAESREPVFDNAAVNNMSIPQYEVHVETSVQTERIASLLIKLTDNQLQPRQQLELVKEVRQIVSDKKSPDISEILGTDILTIIRQILRFSETSEEFREMKLEAIWILANLAYGNTKDIEKILDPYLDIFTCINMILQTQDIQMIEEILWLVANISGDSEELRDSILQNTQILDDLVRLIGTPKLESSTIRVISWVNLNIARYKNLDESHISQCYQVAKACLQKSAESSTLVDTLQSLFSILEMTDKARLDVITNDELVLPKICENIDNVEETISSSALKCIGVILISDDNQVMDRCLWNSVIDKITNLIKQSKGTIIVECCWALSNITAGPCYHIEKFVESAAFELITEIAMSQKVLYAKQAQYVLCNAITGSDLIVREKMLQLGGGKIVSVLVRGCSIPDQKLLANLLDAIDELLKMDEICGWKQTDNSIAYFFEVNGGLDALEQVQKNPNFEIYLKAGEILKEYFELIDNDSMPLDSVDVDGSNKGDNIFNI